VVMSEPGRPDVERQSRFSKALTTEASRRPRKKREIFYR